MTKIITKEIPHIYRNRFLRDNGGSAIISNSGSGGGNTTVYPFEPHYLWGQYFDDTQDISGDLSGVGSIAASGVITASGITLSDFVEAPTVSGTNAVFDTGVFYSGITSNSAIINNISGDTVVLSQSLTAPTISGNSIIGNNISGDTVVLSQSLTAPNISGNSIIGDNISGTNASITSLTATAITSNTINVTNKLTTNQLEAVSGYIKTLLSDEITVDYLTVTKAAHFFKLLIDEIKATQGQIIITPCNAVIDKVETVNGNYRCYFRAKDDDREIYNNFEVNDQVVCQTFNVATGVSYDVSNTYYWRLCVATGTTSTTIDGETVECHYIDLSDSDKDSYSISAPTSGDNVVQLGNRNDSTRQAAIIISAYNQQFLDPTIKAPSIVQYYGINDYHLEKHRRNVISRDFNEFKGNFKTSNGDDIEELIEDVTSGITAYLHTAWANSADGSTDFTKNPQGGTYSYVGLCSNNTESDASLTYSDYEWSYIKGATGASGESAAQIIVTPTVSLIECNSYGFPTSDTFSVEIKGSVNGQIGAFYDFWIENGEVPNTWSYTGSPSSSSITVNFTIPTYDTLSNTTIKTTYQCTVGGKTYTVNPMIVVNNVKDGANGQNGQNGQNGANGEDAEFYKLVPTIEQAVVDKNGNLGVNVQYSIAHISGSNVTSVYATTSGLHVLIEPNNATQSNPYSLLSVNTYSPSYTNTTYQTNYHRQSSKTEYFRARLVSGSSHTIIEGADSYIQVVFEAGATLEITDEINATVQGHSETLSSHTNSIATLNVSYSSITTTVESHTQSINSNSSNISQLEQTSSAISSTVTSISEGDTRNLFYPSCYSSDGMSNPNNQWLLTDILDGTVRCSSWDSSSMKNGKPIVNGWVSAEINTTGEIYLYSPYISLNKNYKYSLTFEGQVYNYCFLEICRYTSQASALSATSNITSVQSLETLGVSTNQYTYNQSIFTFTPSTTSSYNRIRFRLTNTNSNTPVFDLKKISLYQGTTSAGISTGGFAPWIDTISKLTSQITQRSEEINIGLNRAGINLTSGKITSVADNFEWINNEGETVLGLDSNGDANFNGTVRAKNLYKTLALASNDTYTLVLTPEGTTTVWIYVNTTFTCEENGKTYTAGHYYEIPPSELSELYYYPSEAGYFKVITGPADEVIVVSGPYPNGSYYVVLPKSSDYVGKAVTIRHTLVSGKTVTVIQCDGSYNAFSHDGISIYDENNDHTPDIIYGAHMDDDFTISYGQTVTFYSVGLYWIRLHVSE